MEFSLKDTSISISHHSYEQETGKGIFSLGLLVKDRLFPKTEESRSRERCR